MCYPRSRRLHHEPSTSCPIRQTGPKDIAHLWISGYYFHSDPDLRDELEGLNQQQRWLLWNLFVVYVTITSGYIAHVRNVVAQGLDEAWFTF